ncbi:HNH endonuclease [Pseudonocardia endophytica]|uniref:Uncharacterized protein DUF222 n=1 Tax=Pseudonocardia endophytica TaxID=401976 RepID=A0A4R1I9C6_PSEEN|nr:HNH endonuclease [Pseudonocardia endophytica]TCK26832.1 uncharacterized protein DUF222 [Pseudonocardia endophytica]
MFAFVDEVDPDLVEHDTRCAHGIHAMWCDDARCRGPVIDPDRAPGARLARQLQAAGEMPELLSRTEVLDVVEAAETQIRWLHGLRTRMLAEFVDRHPDGSVTAPPGADESAAVPSQRWVPDEIALTLEVSRLEALGEIEQAKRFAHVLPDTLAELEAGRICLRRAEVIARATAVLPNDLARAVEAKVLPKAHDATLRQVRDRVRRAIARVDPDGEYRRHKEADRGRRVSIRALEDGMASLWFYGSAAEIEAAWQVADRLARSLGKDDPRTLDQRRFDLSMQILQGRLTVTDRTDLETAVAEALAESDAGGDDPGGADSSSADSSSAGSDGSESESAEPGATESAGAESASAESNADNSASAESNAADSADAGSGSGGSDVAESAGAGTDPDPTGTDGPPAEPPGDPSRDRPPPDHPIPLDALTAAVADALSRRPDLHNGVGRKPLIQVVVGIDTLMGSDRPGELVGHGPIDADTARALAVDSIIVRLLTDEPTGTLLEHGRKHYAPPAALADHVRARDQICRGPRCTRRVRDLDHHREWALGGDTDQSNLYGLCQHCHQLKDVPGWHCITDPTDPNGDVVWVSPCGRSTTSGPYDYRDYTDDLPDPVDHRSAAVGVRPGRESDTGMDDPRPPF